MTVNFTSWKGITDGQTYGIPDSVDYHLPMDEGTGTNLFDVIGDADHSLVGGWGTDAHFGEISTYDGGGDYAISDDPYDINGVKASWAGWWRFESIEESASRIVMTVDDSSTALDDFWEIIFDGPSNIRVNLSDDGDTTTNVIDNISVSTGTWYFTAISLDGNNVNLYHWDRNQLLDEQSGSANRGTTASARTMLYNSPGLERPTEGDFAEMYGSNETLSKADFETIWEITR